MVNDFALARKRRLRVGSVSGSLMVLDACIIFPLSSDASLMRCSEFLPAIYAARYRNIAIPLFYHFVGHDC